MPSVDLLATVFNKLSSAELVGYDVETVVEFVNPSIILP